ncbi:MAG TPA: hypothetical protein VHB02_18390 [Acidimicrobiales bacterium]|nr:hypothetical protein [Acidimicrobiales bacterium]
MLATGTPAICARCVQAALPPRSHRCPICSHRLSSAGEQCGNPICNWEDRGFGQIYAIYAKTGAVDRILKALKYDGKKGWAVILGRLVLGWLDENLSPDDYDLIIANPTEPGRAIHHTELILEVADGEDLEDVWPIFPDALVKSGPTSQSGQPGTKWRTKWDAANELRSVVTPADWVNFEGARVLLFDDITTICGQIHVLGEMLTQWGASQVDGLVIARTGG